MYCPYSIEKLDLKSLPKRHRWLKETAKTSGSYHAFCTEEVNAKTPWHHYGPDAREAMKDDISAVAGSCKNDGLR
jgi:hypothetical protein